jgi:hypothetical protein
MLERDSTRVPRGGTPHDLYRLGAFAGLLAVGIAVVQIAIEVIGVGLAGVPVPQDVEAWFALLQGNRVLALTELTGLQIPMFVLLVPLFLALHAALRPPHPGTTAVVTAFGLLGIGVHLASNTAFSMASLSDRWATAATEVQRTTVLAAGEAMLATYEGPGLLAGVSLVMLATLAFALMMFRDPRFGRAVAAPGIVAGVIGTSYYFAVAFPAARIFLLEAAAPFFLLWVGLAARGLLRAGRVQPTGTARQTEVANDEHMAQTAN